MPQVDNAKTNERLGAGFWTPWWAGLIALIAGFAAAIRLFLFPSTYAMSAAVVVLTLGLIGLSMAPYAVRRRRGLEGPMRQPARRYMLRGLPPMMIYCFALPGAISAQRAFHPIGIIAWLLALAPVIPLLFFIRAVVLFYLEEDDEYLRAKAGYTHVWAVCLTLAICVTVGFLQMFKLAPRLDLWVLFPLWALCLFPAQYLARRKYG